MGLITSYFYSFCVCVYIYLNSFIDDNKVIGSRDYLGMSASQILPLRKGKPLNMCTELILFDPQKFC